MALRTSAVGFAAIVCATLIPTVQANGLGQSPRIEVSTIQPDVESTVVLATIRETTMQQDREPAEVERPRALPHNLPVPMVFAARKPVPFESNIEWPRSPAEVSVVQSFEALGDNGTWVPPDVSGAVGPSHLFTALNSQIRVQDRNGRSLKTLATNSFFDSVRGTSVAFDPHVTYDARAGRWIACAVADRQGTSLGNHTSSYLLLGISNSADPLGTWSMLRFNGDVSNQTWLDYPLLGLDDSNIVISTNVYSVADDKFQRASVFVISKQTRAATRFDLTNIGGGLSPTVSLDPGSTSFLIQRWNGNSGGAGYLRLYSVAPSGVTPIAYVGAPQTWSVEGKAGGDFAPQLASSRLIDTGDDRTSAAVFRNGSIWVTHSIFLPAGAPTRSSIQWWRISTSGQVQERGLLDDASNSTFYAYPSIAVNLKGDVMVGGTRFTRQTFASAFAAFRLSGSPSSALSSPAIFKEGLASYYKAFEGGPNRWGDYSSTLVDPANDIDFWSLQEYASRPQGSDRWGTWWAKLSPSSGSANSCVPGATTACLLNNRFKVIVRYRSAFDNAAANAVAQVKSVTGFASPTFETSFFYFNNADNIELMIKMLDQGNTNAAGLKTVAVLYGSATPLRVEIAITDTQTGIVRQYTSAFGKQAGQTDFTAFVK